MNVQFTHPQWLWLLPVALAWVLWLAWSSFAHASSARRGFSCGLRLLVTLLVVLAIAGIQWLSPIEGMNVLFVLDRSESVPASQQETARRWIHQVAADKKPDDRAGVIVFGANASIESTAASQLSFQKFETIVPGTRTDIASALRLASAAFPENGQRRIVLISDGNENLGDALQAAASAHALGANVDVVAMARETSSDLSIQRIQLPPHVKKSQPFEAKVFVHADEPGPATLRLYRNDAYLGEQSVQLDAGKNLLTFPQTLTNAGFYNYDVQLDAPNDTLPENNRSYAFTQVRGLPRILVVSNDPVADDSLIGSLKTSDAEVSVIGPNSFPGSLAELQSFDSIVLCNISAGDLARSQQEQLEIALRDFGTGLVCVGGDQSYGAGAYRGTPLAAMLPVEVELSSKKVLPPGALVLVIDQSGSMSGEKLEMAKQAAIAAIQALAPSDYASVIAFDGAPHVVADLQKVGDQKDLAQKIAGIHGGGGTVMYAPMQRAHEMLRAVNASYKHCVVLTDGVSQPGDFSQLASAMAADRITVSTVGIGNQIDANLLQTIAGLGNGRFYSVPDPKTLPQIFIKESAVVLKSAISEEPFNPQLAFSSEPIRGISPGDYPPLLGYVVTEPKARAETPLTTGNGDPLLAHWQYGLGRAAAFTSDAQARWARNWIDWPQYRQFWRQIVQWSLRRLENSDIALEVATDRGEGRISADAVDANGNFQNFLNLRATVIRPNGEKQTVPLRQNGPGHYEAEFSVRETGLYLVNLLQMEGEQVRASLVAGASLNYSPEHDASKPNMRLLAKIAESTGGKQLNPAFPGSNPFYDDRHPTWQKHDIWETFLKLAVILFVVDVGTRRLNPEFGAFKSWLIGLPVVGHFLRNPTNETASEEGSVASLLARRDGARERHSAQGPALERPLSIGEKLQPQTLSPSPTAAKANEAPGPKKTNTTPPIPEGQENAVGRLLAAKRRGDMGKS